MEVMGNRGGDGRRGEKIGGGDRRRRWVVEEEIGGEKIGGECLGGGDG